MTTKPSKSVMKQKILELVNALEDGKTICPSQVARDLSENDWRALMPDIRYCADELSADGVIRISQKGKKIASASEARGPIRLSRAT